MNLYMPEQPKVDFVRNRLRDENSRLVFESLLKFYTTGDDSELQEEVFKPKLETLGLLGDIEKLRQLRKKGVKIAVWGMGDFGKLLLLLLHHYELTPDFIIDKIKKKLPTTLNFNTIELLKDKFSEIPFFTPDEAFGNIENTAIVVGARTLSNEIMQKLDRVGYSRDLVFDGFVEKCDVAKYFESDLLKSIKDEIYLDCGTFDMKNVIEFCRFSNNRYKKIYAFEASPVNCLQMQETADKQNIRELSIVNSALWSNSGVLRFNDRNGSGSFVTSDGGIVVDAVTIDKAVGDDDVTLIKMDIEGAELEALKGAERTIKRCHPRMAICVYHKETDIIEIPEYILSIAPDYQVFLTVERFILSDVVMWFV